MIEEDVDWSVSLVGAASKVSAGGESNSTALWYAEVRMDVMVWVPGS